MHAQIPMAEDHAGGLPILVGVIPGTSPPEWKCRVEGCAWTGTHLTAAQWHRSSLHSELEGRVEMKGKAPRRSDEERKRAKRAVDKRARDRRTQVERK
jgi:hypothetical protein